jgi:DNA-binding transcriptional regulator GbsR (MarR family)
MSFPSKEDLDVYLAFARQIDPRQAMEVRAETLIYLIENLRRVNDEVRELADRVDELHDDYNKQLRRAKKWKRRYTALENKQHEERQQGQGE